MELRPANHGDLDAILAIYNDAILNSTALWTDTPVDRADRETWLTHREALGHPVFVAEVDGVVIGYGSYGPWQSRFGYRYTVEDTIYISSGLHGQGIGRALLTALVEHARAAGLHIMIADIDSGNTASIALHEKLGFEQVGVVREAGIKYGGWLDLTIMRLAL